MRYNIHHHISADMQGLMDAGSALISKKGRIVHWGQMEYLHRKRGARQGLARAYQLL